MPEKFTKKFSFREYTKGWIFSGILGVIMLYFLFINNGFLRYDDKNVVILFNIIVIFISGFFVSLISSLVIYIRKKKFLGIFISNFLFYIIIVSFGLYLLGEAFGCVVIKPRENGEGMSFRDMISCRLAGGRPTEINFCHQQFYNCYDDQNLAHTAFGNACYEGQVAAVCRCPKNKCWNGKNCVAGIAVGEKWGWTAE